MSRRFAKDKRIRKIFVPIPREMTRPKQWTNGMLKHKVMEVQKLQSFNYCICSNRFAQT